MKCFIRYILPDTWRQIKRGFEELLCSFMNAVLYFDLVASFFLKHVISNRQIIAC